MAFKKMIFLLALPALLGTVLLFPPIPGSAQNQDLEERSNLAQTEQKIGFGNTSQIQPLALGSKNGVTAVFFPGNAVPDQERITTPCQASKNPGECGNQVSQRASRRALKQCEQVRVKERAAEENREQVQTKERAENENQDFKTTDTLSIPKGVQAAINLPEETVEALRDEGLGYGEIVIIQELVRQSGKTAGEVITLFNQGYGWGEIASLLGVDFHGIGEVVSQGQKNNHRGK